MANNPYFKFRRVPSFFMNMNRKDCFDLLDMNGTDENFKVVLVSECANSISDCLDEDGTLKEWDDETRTGVKILNTLGEKDGLTPMLYSMGVNNESKLSITNTSLVYELTDSVDYVKGAFLTSYGNGSGFVLAYTINNVPLEVQDDTLILMLNGMIWGTHYVGE